MRECTRAGGASAPQDAGGDIVALCDNSGSVGGAAFVAAQWTYDAYGSVFSADHLSPHPFMHAGHKGLFFDRLDVGVADAAVQGAGGGVGAAGGGESPRLVPFAHSIIHNRNRAYNPQFGRFMQADPNASALALLEASYCGKSIAAIAAAFDLTERYGDGSNIFEYLGSNPWMRSDPMGTEWRDDFEGVVLPIISIADNAIGFGVFDALNELLDGYNIIIKLAATLATHANTQEDMVDWALDWNADDDEWFSTTLGGQDLSARTGSIFDGGSADAGPAMAGMGPRRVPTPGQRAAGKQAEAWGREHTKSVPVKRQSRSETSVCPETGKPFGRHYDGFDGDKYFEIKAGGCRGGEVKARVMRQILRDMVLQRERGLQIRWLFDTKDGKTTDVDDAVRNALDNAGIGFEVRKWGGP